MLWRCLRLSGGWGFCDSDFPDDVVRDYITRVAVLLGEGLILEEAQAQAREEFGIDE